MDQQNLQQPDENQPEKIPSIPLGEPEEQKPSKKYLFLIIIASSVIAALVYGGYLYLKPQNVEESTTLEKNQETTNIKLSDSKQTNTSTIENPVDRNLKRKDAIFQLVNALKQYYASNNKYPEMRSSSIAKTGIFSDNPEVNPLVPEYLKNIIIDPTNKNNYNYYYEEELGKYLLFTKLEPSDDQQDSEQYFCVDSYTVDNSPTTINFNPLTTGRCTKNITEEKQLELTSPLLISELRQIMTALELYQSMNGYFPTKLIDLYPGIFTNKDLLQKEDVFYAYYPAANPLNYHLGIAISNTAQELNEDKDFNSKSNGYINGFDGKDPIYDLTN